MKRQKTRKLKLDRRAIRILTTPDLGRVDGGGHVPDGYGFSLNRNNCGENS